MLDVKEVKRTWESNPIFWTIVAVVGTVLTVILVKWFISILWAVIGYVFGFGIFGIALYALDFHTFGFLGRRQRRIYVAGGIAVLWAGLASSSLLSFQFAENIILAFWSTFIMFVAFSIGAMIMKNRDTIVSRFDDVVQRRAKPLDVLKEAADATKSSVKGGVDDARKATFGKN